MNSRRGGGRRPCRVLWLAMAAFLLPPVAARAGGKGHHASAPHPPAAHHSAPKAPQVHALAPKTSQAHSGSTKAPGHATKPTSKTTAKPASKPTTKPGATSTNAQSQPTGTTHPAVVATTRTTTPRVAGRRRVGYVHRSAGYLRRRRTRSTVNPALHRLMKLKADLDHVTPKAQINQTQRNVLKQDLMGVAEGPVRPTYSPLQQLSGHLTDALSARKLPEIDTAQMAYDLKAVMNGVKLGRPDVEQAIARTKSQLQSAGTPAAEVRAVTDGLNAVVAEMRNRGLALGGQGQRR